MATNTVYICVVILLSCALFSVVLGESAFDNFYVSSNRLGCESVDSLHLCPATLLNPDLAVDYETDTDEVNITLDIARTQYNASSECITAMKMTYCSRLTPKCYVNGSKDYSDARMACSKAKKTCPQDSFEERTCDGLKVGLQPLSACVKPSKPLNGSCPQPKYKMPQEKLDLYMITSVEFELDDYFANLSTTRYANGSQMFSSECITKIKELNCLPFYCSTDEKQIIVEYTFEDCEDIFSRCFDRVIDNLFEGQLKEYLIELQEDYKDNCVFYPDADTPTSSGSPSTDIITRPFQSVSFTTPRKNITTTPKQKTPSPPPGQNISSPTPGQNISSPTPGQNISSPTPGQTKTSTIIPGQTKTSTILPGQNVSSPPPDQNISSPSPKITSPHPKVIKIITPTEKPEVEVTGLENAPYPTCTAAHERCQYFPLLLFLFLFLVVLVI